MRSKIKELIDKSNSILLLTHESPDGDAIGSVLSFYHYLSSINKNVDMVVLDIPRVFDFLSSIDNVVDTTDRNYDLGIVLDCATEKRIGQNDDLLSRCKTTICIDHHQSNTNYCDINLVDGNISSCCQVIYYLFKEWKIIFNKDIGEAIINGVLTDTDGFGINTVDSDTFNMAAEILNLGVNVHNIYSRVLWKKSMPQYELMKTAMSRLELLCNGKIAYTYILKEDFDKFGASLGDHEGIVDIGKNIDGVEVSIFLREKDGWTISLRSTGNVDVNKIASKVNGGGHIMAAGGKTTCSLEETKTILINEIEKVINQ